ncbi:glycosyltransferase [Flavobacterium supellecticarium]|uniref:Glycosyltransferase n=1 Tax=Flavobacterium supellecticarium TaxID=2565924 RepID=A0A4S4A005_9FLAO|nr:glycosyltransferase [Flavobacterium supellecticarium]THF51613.1 glycosyltransferase [Flavobacterium supellecticarium]
MSESPKISALAIIRNEEDNIRAYLRNMAFADEIIVVDSYSSDATLDIIRSEFPQVRIVQRPFDDFSRQRNFAIDLATNDWVTFFDADERVTENGIRELLELVASHPEEVAFWVKRAFYYAEKPMFYGGQNQDRAIRLFRKSKCRYSHKLVHEQLIVNGKTGILKEIIHHYSFKNKADFLGKRLQYSQLRAQELYQKNTKPTAFHFYIKPAFRFFKHYIIEFGFLNGSQGVSLAKIMSQHVYMRYVYLQQLLRNENRNPGNLTIGYEAKRVFHNQTGLGNYSRDLVRILNRFYPENNYLLYNPKPAKKQLFTSDSDTIIEKRPTNWFNRKFYNIWRQRTIISDLKKDGVQLFHGLSGELPSGLQKAGIKSTVTIHDLIFMRYPEFYSFFDRKIHFYKFKKAAQSADTVIAISEQTKKDIVQYLKIPESKIEVIYQGCQQVFKETYTDQEKKAVIEKYKLPEQFVLNVGTIETRKNVLAAVKAIRNIDTKLVIIGGETAYTQTVKNYIQEHQMDDKVLFLKGLNSRELAMVYQLATVFIYPSLFEGFGIPIIEALYSKTPVITTNSGVFPEAGGPDSLYVDPNDSADIQSKIELLLRDPDLRDEITEKGYMFVQKFNDDAIANRIMTLYKSL